MTLRIPGRVAFLVPWPRHWLIGTTDKPYHGSLDRPAASGDDVDELLGTVNGAMDVGLTRDDVVGTYAGLRPLIAPSDATSTVKVSREHRVSVEARGPRPGQRRQVHDVSRHGPGRGRCRARDR